MKLAFCLELRGRKWSHRQDLHPAFAHTKGEHRFLCFGGKLRHAGDAPASPRWQRGVLLIDECREKWSGGKVLPPRELGVGQPCYCYITAGFSNWPLELELRQPLGLFRPAHISLCHPAKKSACGRSCTSAVYPMGLVLQTMATHLAVASHACDKLVRDVGFAPTLRVSQTRVRTGYTIP